MVIMIWLQDSTIMDQEDVFYMRKLESGYYYLRILTRADTWVVCIYREMSNDI